MTILGLVEWLGHGVAAALAGWAAIGLVLAGRDRGAPALQPVRVRARRR
ncbi:hypothetical protein AFCDBAGC_1986 [Methylobacterium cerastii]|uniref:Uncharacterized protein n=1 Tax=Methylobacterium cerastii TaxID=932741 RepID=A0ABQ4QGU6_9HYPH|nr:MULTISPECIES: hypothetical protein [Methylobacterium]GJD44122.1 hypothetical protein AFCDBAGC_1986 [Methylobacterium cerastii]